MYPLPRWAGGSLRTFAQPATLKRTIPVGRGGGSTEAGKAGHQTPRVRVDEKCHTARGGGSRQGREKRRRRNEAGVEPRDEVRLSRGVDSSLAKPSWEVDSSGGCAEGAMNSMGGCFEAT